MDLFAILDRVREQLAQRGRITYRMLRAQFKLDDGDLEALREELIEGQQVAVDEGGKVLVWTGAAAPPEMGRQKIEGAEPRPVLSNAESGPDGPRDLRLDTAERRQLTVMFCDLVGSTALSEQLDPEELREVVQHYQATCTAVIRRYAGHIAQHLGDGLLVYFGYPVAHEDDAARAVRAGVGIVAALQKQNGGGQPAAPLQVRIGIHTGLVVIGAIGSREQREILALGETPNLAARVQGVAEPNMVVISAATQRLVHGLFACQDLGPQFFKGVSTPVAVYRVVGDSSAQSRFEAAVNAGLTPLIGRELEVGLLRERWWQAKRGAGQVVLLSGEPGIGKSRLVQEFKEQLVHEGITCIEFRCSPYHQNSALYPLIEHLQRLLQFAREDSPAIKLEKLQHLLSRYRFPQADTVPLLAALLSLPHPEGFPPITMSPQKQKEKTQVALVAWLIEEAAQQPVYNTWEDTHWADPSTLEVLTLLMDQAPTTQLIVLLTFRPEFSPPWSNRSHLSHITLSRLGHRQTEAMVEQVMSGKALSAAIVQQIVSKTDGVPLFVEELTKTVVESGLSEGAQPAVPGLLAIPATLQDSLMARLDRLGSAKDIAQLGATIGREFSYELLHAVTNRDAGSLQQGLQRLVEAELLYQRGLVPQASYTFKHALVQDAAYQSLLKSKRQQLHQQIAHVIVVQFVGIADTQPELVAHHYTEAGLGGQAVPYWQRAGQRAIERSANLEATGHLTKGLEVLKSLPATLERSQQELTLQIALGVPLIHIKGYAAPEVERTYTRARELCQQVGETPQLFSTLWGLWLFYVCGGGHRETARELGEQLLGLAKNVHDRAPLAHYTLGCSLFLLGEFTQGREHLEHGLALYNPQWHGSYAFLYSQDPRVVCSTYAAWSPWFLGYPDQALKKNNEMLTFAQDLSHPFSLAFALNFAAMLHQFRGEVQAAQEWADAAVTRCTEQGFPFWLAPGTILQGWLLAERGQTERGIVQIRQGLSSYRATGADLYRPYFLALLADACGKGGKPEEGLSVIAEALDEVQRTRERYYEAELYRLKGALLQQASVPGLGLHLREEAKECFQKALEIARKQQAKSLELRASTSLARLWQQQGKQHEAHELLAEIYGWFTEGFDTKDLQEAKTLLDELGAGR